MTKKELLIALDGLDDNAEIFVDVPDNDILNIVGYQDKETCELVQNEITLVCR